MYKPPSLSEERFSDERYSAISHYNSLYKTFVLPDDFKIPNNSSMLNDFCDAFSFKNLITEPTCYKGMNPSCTDHILTNIPSHFMKSCALIEAGISDYHKMIMTIFRGTFARGKSKTYVYQCYKNFDKQRFEETLSAEHGENNLTFDKFVDIFINTLDKHVE